MRVYQESELKEVAEEISKHITVRTWKDGNSYDNERESTEEEKTTLFNIVYGALLGCNWGEKNRNNKDCQQSIVDSAEYTTHLFLPHANSYDTVYIPMQEFLRTANEIANTEQTRRI